jgi:hypothetical protein
MIFGYVVSPLNEENFKPNFVLFGDKLKKL